MDSKLANTFKADILIVDDTPDNIRFLSSLLLDKGYNVRKSINGQMALTAVKTLQPDLILLDINMSGMNGYEVCERLKEDTETSSVPVIFLSALDDVLDKVKAFQVGGVDYITKPFQIEEVLARIQNQLTIQSLQTQLKNQNSQLQQALGDLKKAQAQLVQKEKMLGLGQLAAGMAHEINNSIGFISGNLDPARKYIQDLLNLVRIYQQEYPKPTLSIQKAIQEIDLDFLNSDIQNLVGSMQTGVERICTMLLALRIFSRLNESDIKAVDIHEGLNSTLLLLQHRLRGEGKRPEIQVIKKYEDLPLVNCYASQLNQAFLNILNNAIDALELRIGQEFSESSSPTIWISTELVVLNT
ncbi:response regulator [Coleofasciculus sp. FACHB-129]|uniref:hybrid sensor histidine kinase/response regulator n=1 Tax=Cyanophyceae TaxID=3028117 RepID=UPI001689CE3E|nr:response regulator [Coleofasciculus sp. FACHB-129]MBD1898025.1 response regulator [Coleofasciculus sp. FACHB-129]